MHITLTEIKFYLHRPWCSPSKSEWYCH